MIVIFSYQRKERLQSLVNELWGEAGLVIDDGSDYDEKITGCKYLRFPHQGREGFWKLWDYTLKICKESNHNRFLFLQDDVENVQLDEIKRITKNLDTYAFNIMNRGKDRGWVKADIKKVTIEGVECETTGYVDCIFATNRKTLDLIGWEMNPVPDWWLANKNLSSGVGMQLSRRFHEAGVTMIKPVASLAYHGDHESLMHPETRKREPLISK